MWKEVLNWILGKIIPPLPERYQFNDRIGFRVDTGNHPLCPICLGAGKVVPGTYDGAKKMVCPEHRLVTGAQPVVEPDDEEIGRVDSLAPDLDTPKIWLSLFTATAFEINAAYDAVPEDQPTFTEIYSASDKQQLVRYLARRYHQLTDFSFVLYDKDKLEILERSLSDAAEALRGRESRKTGIKSHGFSLLQAIVLEAIQQQYAPFIFNVVNKRDKYLREQSVQKKEKVQGP